MQNQSFFSYAFGVGTKNQNGDFLEVYYPNPKLHPCPEEIQQVTQILNYQGGCQSIEIDILTINKLQSALREKEIWLELNYLEELAKSQRPIVAIILEQDQPPTSTAEAYLKLQLISRRLVKPHETNLTGIFPLLPNVAWTNQGAIDPQEIAQSQFQARLNNQNLEVYSVDKFPKMVNYHVPSGVRIADAARVRLGAYLGEGTTVMHEGFVNFNAGTEGVSMVEGRISAGVVVGAHSDLGGSSSTLGTLSGGNNVLISVGTGCLLGANSGLGIPLGDNCTIESGLFVTAGSKVQMISSQGEAGKIVKAKDLSGTPNLLFRRNSLSGGIECLEQKSAIELNDELHRHN